MKIFLGADHRGVDLRNALYNYLEEEGLDVEVSKIPNNEFDDYPDFAFDVCHNVIKNESALGILICGN